MSLVHILPYYANGTNAPTPVGPPVNTSGIYSNTGNTLDGLYPISGVTTDGTELILSNGHYAGIAVGDNDNFVIEYEYYTASSKTAEIGLLVNLRDGASPVYFRATPSYGAGFGGPLTSWNYTGGQGGIGSAITPAGWHSIKIEKVGTTLNAYIDGATTPSRTTTVNTVDQEDQMLTLICSPALGTAKFRNITVSHTNGAPRFKPHAAVAGTTDRPSGTAMILTDNLVATSTGGWTSARPTGFGKTSGKWYYEAVLVNHLGVANPGYSIIGIDAGEHSYSSPTYPNAGTNALVMAGPNVFNTLQGPTNTANAGYTTGDKVAFVVDLDASPQVCKFYKNETLVWTQELPAGKTWYPTYGHFTTAGAFILQTANRSSTYENAVLWA